MYVCIYIYLYILYIYIYTHMYIYIYVCPSLQQPRNHVIVGYAEGQLRVFDAEGSLKSETSLEDGRLGVGLRLTLTNQNPLLCRVPIIYIYGFMLGTYKNGFWLVKVPGKPVACCYGLLSINYGLLSINYGLLWGIVGYDGYMAFHPTSKFERGILARRSSM